MEQARLAFLQPGGFGLGPAPHVALQLHKGFLHRVGAGGRAFLALHHRQRNAVHEQHDVGHHEFAHAARRGNAELVDGVEAVAFGVVEVDQPHHRVHLAGGLVHVHLRLDQQLVGRLVGLQQRALRLAEQLRFQLVELGLGKPRRAVGQQVDGAHRVAEHTGQPPWPKAAAQAGSRVLRQLRALVDHRPALGGQLRQEGAFDFGVFAHGTPLASSPAAVSR